MNKSDRIKWTFGLLSYTIIVFILFVYIDSIHEYYQSCCDPILKVAQNKSVITYYLALIAATVIISIMLYKLSGKKSVLLTLVIPSMIAALTLRELSLLNKNMVDFDSQTWKAEKPVQMAIDIHQSDDFVGTSREDAIELLGVPDKDSGGLLAYYTSYTESISKNVKTNIGCVTLELYVGDKGVQYTRLPCAQ